MLLRLLCAVVVTGSIQSLQQFYVSPEVAARMASDLRERLAKGEFQSVTNGAELAHQLTADLQEISHDQHLRVQFFATGAPPTRTSLTPSTEELESERRDGLGDNFGFAQARRLPGNVGYLDIRAFHTLALAKPAVIAAMRVVAHTEALIVDLRGNFGGEPECVTFVASYLFDEPVHLDTLVMRWGTGVVPDVAVEAGDAAVTAYRLALDSIIDSTTDTAQKAQLRGINAEQALRGLAR